MIIEAHAARGAAHRRDVDAVAAQFAEGAVADRPFGDRADHRRSAAQRSERDRDIRLGAADMRAEARRLQRQLALRNRDAHDDFAETGDGAGRSEENTSELQALMRISYAV